MKLESFNITGLMEGRLRMVYLRPSMVGDEAIAVGVLFQLDSSVRMINIESPLAYSTLRCLRGDATVDNVIFSLQILKQNIQSDFYRIEDFESPSSDFFLGGCQPFVSVNPEDYVGDYLKVSSCLLDYKKKSAPKKTITQSDIGKVLFNEVSRLDVISATRLFEGYDLEISKGRKLSFPIYGKKIIAAPVSMMTKQVAAAKNLAEAYCAKLSLARTRLDRDAVIYVMSPPIQGGANYALVEDSLGEIDIVAEANEIIVRVEKNPEELAHAILYDEQGRIN